MDQLFLTKNQNLVGLGPGIRGFQIPHVLQYRESPVRFFGMAF